MGNAALQTWRYDDMPSLDGRRKIEKLDGIIYDMSPSANYRHGIVNGNIYNKIYTQLRGSLCNVFMENLDLRISGDEWVIPDIMIVCDRSKIKTGTYHGIPKFVVETVSPSSIQKDRRIKKRKYASIGVDEFWLVEPKGKSLEIYYLENGAYELQASYLLDEDPENKEYDADTVITLRRFPNISMTLGDIFYDLDR